jgi:hypothetical protein
MCARRAVYVREARSVCARGARCMCARRAVYVREARGVEDRSSTALAEASSSRSTCFVSGSSQLAMGVLAAHRKCMTGSSLNLPVGTWVSFDAKDGNTKLAFLFYSPFCAATILLNI